MKYNAHEYQKYAIRYIIGHEVSAIFLDCGMGKTSITLTAIEKLMHEKGEVKKVLIIAPLRVARNVWTDEVSTWDHLSDLRCSRVVGSAKERKAALLQDADIYIINRENLSWLVEKSGYPFDFDMVVIDELSSFKNWKSKRFRAFMQVRPLVKRVVGLTGTPSPNGLMDLFAQIRCLDMGQRLGRFITQYRTAYFRPGRSNGNIVYEYIPLPDAEQRIYDRISDITISMKAMDHLKMPELISTNYTVYMDEYEMEQYEELRKELVLDIDAEEITAANAAVLSGKLSQLANGIIYSDSGEAKSLHIRKLDALEDIIEAANGKPLLVSYWFRHDLERIEERLKQLKVGFERLTDDESIRKWNRGEVEVGLIHPASAGHGLNLQKGGNHLVFYSCPWSLELYQQTVARLWRQGQTNETVIIQHIVTHETIDEDIISALERKEKVQEQLITAVKAQIGKSNGRH